MENQTEIERLEERILNGGTVSAAEFSAAMRNSDAEKRINQLEAERTIRNVQSDLQQLAVLKEQARKDGITPFELLSIGNQIDSLENKIRGEK
jgi:DNA-binding ferritin-like protein